MVFNPPVSSVKQSNSSSDISFSLWHTLKSHIPRFLLTILFDIILPLILFFLLQKRIKSMYALLIAGLPPMIIVLIKVLLTRTFDVLAFLVFISFLISMIVVLLTHNEIILLLEKSLVTGVISLIFAMTLIPFRCHCRPLAFYFYQNLVPISRVQMGLPDRFFNAQDKRVKIKEEQESTEIYRWIYEHCSSFRFACYLITSIWSMGFLFEFLARLTLILLHLSINKIIIYGHIILSSVTILCIILTIICMIEERKRTVAWIQQWKEKYSTIQCQSEQSQLPIWTVCDRFNANDTIDQVNNC